MLTRKKLLGLIVLLSLAVAIPATGAFSSITADRGVSVAVENDSDAFLGLEPHDSANGGYADTVDDQLVLQFDDSVEGIDGDGVNPEAITRFDDVFNVTNQGTQRVAVSVNDDSNATAYHVYHDGERVPIGELEIALDPGETAEVGIQVDSDTQTDALIPDDVTITAEAIDETDPIIGDPDDPDDDDPGIVLPDTDAAQLSGVNGIVVGSNLSEDTSTTVDTPRTQRASYTGVELTALEFAETDVESASLHLEQREGPPRHVPALDTDDTVLTNYVATTDEATASQTVTFRFQLDEEVVDDPDAVQVHRYSDGWETLETSIEETSDGFLVDATAPGFSTYAVTTSADLYDDGPDGPTVLQNIETHNEVDIEDDGFLSAFDVRAEVDFSDVTTDDDPTITVRIDDAPVETHTLEDGFNGSVPLTIDWQTLAELDRGTYDVHVDVRDGELATGDRIDSETITVDVDPPSDSEEQASEEFYNEVNATYTGFHEETYNASYRNEVAQIAFDDAADRAVEIITDQIESLFPTSLRDVAVDVLLEVVPGGEVIEHAMGAADAGFTAVDTAIFLGDVGVGVQQESTAIYLEATEPETTELRDNLVALEQNTEALQEARAADDEQLELELLEERRTLIRETYVLIPEHVDAVHEELIADSVGLEDRSTYAELRSQSELLRQILIVDYAMTTEELTGSPESLTGTQAMPTQGWERGDQQVVYDTMTYPDDFAVYSVEVSESVAEDGASVVVQGDTVDRFDAFETDEQPFDVPNATGEALSDPFLQFVPTIRQTRESTFNESGEHFIVVRGSEGVGQYRIASSDAEIEPVTRADPPDQRPGIELTESPEPFELEETDHTVYAADDPDVTLAWDLEDAQTPPSDLEYRYRVDSGDGFSELSEWQQAGDDEAVTLDLDLDEGVHRVQIVVRNDQYMQTVDSVDVVVSTFEPQTFITTDDDVASSAFFARIVPDRRIAALEIQSRELGDEEWDEWRNVTETTDLGRFDVSETGVYEFRARAISPSGNVGEWDRTRLVYLGPPDITLETAPKTVQTNTNPVVTERVTDEESVTVEWSVQSELTDTSELEYRTRVTELDGTGSWTNWQSAPADGEIEVTEAVPEGESEFEIEVRDERDRVTNDSVEVVSDRTSPTIEEFDTLTDVNSGTFEFELDQRVRELELQYAPIGEDDEWETLTTRTHVSEGNVSFSESLAPGGYVVRAQATDYTGAPSEWRSDEVVSLDSDGDGRNFQSDDGGGSIGAGDSYTSDVIGSAVRIDFGFISGDALIELYRVTRDGRGERLESIALEPQDNQTLAVDVPGPLLEDAEGMELVVREGNVFLDSLRAFRTDQEVDVIIEPERPTAGENVSLRVDESEFVEGSISTVEWDVTDDGTTDAEGVEVNETYDTAGNQSGAVTVTDVFDRTFIEPFTVPVNAPPEAAVDAPDEELTLTEVTFDGTESVDPDGEIVAYEWTVDETVVEQGDDATTFSRAFDDAGEYNVTLTATDDEGATDSETHEVTIENRPPVVEQERAPEVPLVDESVTFDAGDSFDRDGEIVAYEWDLDGDGATDATGETIDHAFENGGEQDVTLTVTDDDGAANESTATVFVNTPPEAAFSEETPELTLNEVTLDAGASSDEEGAVTSYEWTVDGEPLTSADSIDVVGTASDDESLTIVATASGTYPVTLTVEDEFGATDSVTEELVIENRPPVVVLETLFDDAVVGETAGFSGSESFDRDGDIVEFEWLIDGTPVTETDESVYEHTFQESGDRELTLRVTDDDGASNETTQPVYVREQPDATFDAPDEQLTLEDLTLNSTATTDPVGDIVEREWTVERYDEDADEFDTVATASGETAEYVPQENGTFRVTHSVVDDADVTDETATNVTVLNRPPDAEIMTFPEGMDQPVAGKPLLLNGTASTDPDGEVVAYEWQIGDEVVSDEPVYTFEPEAGTVDVTLTVIDNDGATNTTVQTVDVRAAPTIEAASDVDIVEEEPAGFEVAATTDDAGEIVSYEWIVDDEVVASGEFAELIFDEPGEQNVTVIATDDVGATATETLTVDVEPASADFGVDIRTERGDEIEVGQTQFFVANVDENRDFRFEWDFTGDGEFVDASDVTEHAYDDAGTYDVTVRAIDADGRVDTATKSQTVLPEDGEWETTLAGSGGDVLFEHDIEGKSLVGVTSDIDREADVVHVLDGDFGEVQWETTTDDQGGAAAVDDAVVVHGDHDITVYNATTGVEETAVELEERIFSIETVSTQDGSLVLADTDAGVTGVDADTGSVLWDRGDEWGFLKGVVTVEASDTPEEVAVIATEDGQHAVNVTDNSTRWSKETETADEVLRIIDDPRGGTSIMMSGVDDGITAVNLETGEERWHVPDQAWISDATAVDEYVLIEGESAVVHNAVDNETVTTLEMDSDEFLRGTAVASNGVFAAVSNWEAGETTVYSAASPTDDLSVTLEFNSPSYRLGSAAGEPFVHDDDVAAVGDGELAWGPIEPEGFIRSVSTHNKLMTVETNEQLVVLDPETGEVQLERTFDGGLRDLHHVEDGYIIRTDEEVVRVAAPEE